MLEMQCDWVGGLGLVERVGVGLPGGQGREEGEGRDAGGGQGQGATVLLETLVCSMITVDL